MRKKYVLKGVLNMLMHRKLVNKNDTKKIFDKLNLKDNKFVIPTNNGNNIIYLINDEISSINKMVSLINFLKQNVNENKIIICKKMQKKAMDQINDYPNTELFTEDFILYNILDHVLQPKFELIDYKEIENINVQKNQFSRMESIDPVARYLNLKPGDILRVIKYNENSCNAIDYRIVIYTPISKLFERKII